MSIHKYLSASVGSGGRNYKQDVGYIQCMLNELLKNERRFEFNVYKPAELLKIDGDSGRNTEKAIRQYQRKIRMSHPDSRVDLNGHTQKTMESKFNLSQLKGFSQVALALVLPKKIDNSKPVSGDVVYDLTGTPYERAKTFIKSGNASKLSYPIDYVPKSYVKGDHAGARWFGAHRSDNRKHAGVDLGSNVPRSKRISKRVPIYAMDDGKVLLAPNQFVKNQPDVGSIIIKHDCGVIVRYCEDSPSRRLVKKGDSVKKGQKLGCMGVFKSTSSMLHLEIYGDANRVDVKGKERLTNRGSKPYQRRSDLMDPTTILEDCKSRLPSTE